MCDEIIQRVSPMTLEMTSPQEFFHKELNSILRSHKLTLSKDVEYYIVNLLCTYIAPEMLNLQDGDYNPLNTPLAILFEKAVQAPIEEQFKILKSVGDTSLYVSGFFQDYFNKKTFNLEYFITIGINAYENVSHITRNQTNRLQTSLLYEKLAVKFPQLVEIVAILSDKFGDTKDLDIVATYERWVENKSERLLKKLNEQGIIPIPRPSKKNQ